MKKAIVAIAGIVVLLLVGVYHFNRAAECFGSTGAVKLTLVKEIRKGDPIALNFRMLRIAAPGCFKGHASESYQDVSCGYRVGESARWEVAKLFVVTDSETEFVVNCVIPPVSSDTAAGVKLDYYFQYSPWGRSSEKQSASVVVN